MTVFNFKSNIHISDWGHITFFGDHDDCAIHLNVIPGKWDAYEYNSVVKLWKDGAKETLKGFYTTEEYVGTDCGYISVHNCDAVVDIDECKFVGDDEQFNAKLNMGGDGGVDVHIHKNQNGQIDGFVLDPWYELKVADGVLVKADGSEISSWSDI